MAFRLLASKCQSCSIFFATEEQETFQHHCVQPDSGFSILAFSWFIETTRQEDHQELLVGRHGWTSGKMLAHPQGFSDQSACLVPRISSFCVVMQNK